MIRALSIAIAWIVLSLGTIPTSAGPQRPAFASPLAQDPPFVGSVHWIDPMMRAELCLRRSDGSRNASHMMPNAASTSQSTWPAPCLSILGATQHLGWEGTVAPTYCALNHIHVICENLFTKSIHRDLQFTASWYEELLAGGRGPVRGWGM